MLEVTLNVIGGGSFTAMLLGMDPEVLEMAHDVVVDAVQIGVAIGSPGLTPAMNNYDVFDNSAKALLLMGGFNTGIQLGASVMGMIGLLYTSAQPVTPGNPVGMSPPRTSDPSGTYAVPDSGLVRISGDSLFDFDKSIIKPAAQTVLRNAGDYIKAQAGRKVVINGYTDNVGSVAYNLGLSERRAKAVAKWFVDNQFVTAANVTTFGRGLSDP